MVKFLEHLLSRSAGTVEAPVRPRPVSRFEAGPPPLEGAAAEPTVDAERDQDETDAEQARTDRRPRAPAPIQPPLRTIVVETPPARLVEGPATSKVVEAQIRPPQAPEAEGPAQVPRLKPEEVPIPGKEAPPRPTEAPEHRQRPRLPVMPQDEERSPRAPSASVASDPSEQPARPSSPPESARPAAEARPKTRPVTVPAAPEKIRPADGPDTAAAQRRLFPAEQQPAILPRVEQIPTERPLKAEADATIEVTIGRIEVRAARPDKPSPRERPKPREPGMSLAEYLERRAKGTLP